MARKRRRREEAHSGGYVAISIVSAVLLIGITISLTALKMYRRHARNQDNAQVNGNRDGGFNAPQPNNPFPQNPPQPKVLKPGVTDTTPEGGIFANNEYREYRQDGALLIGFEIGLGAVPDTAVVTYLRPIWLTAKGEQFGTAYGRTNNPVATVRARDGYAIGGVRIKGGGAMEGLCFTFMRRGEKQLIADDFYISDWYGEQTRKLPENDLRNGDGGFVIGIHGKRFDDKGGTQFDDSGCIGTLGFVTWVKE